MPYGNYTYTIDSSFQPFSMQEMLVPFAMYKDEFEKQEAMLDELSKNTDTFKYLEQVAKDNPESKAAQIYNTYASDLRKYGDDFSANGLSMANSRGLRNMKRRYQGEIGRLAKADEALRQERELRRKLGAQDSSILYANDNLSIDSFLDNATPNLYSISGNDLYARGAAAGKAASARIYSDPQVRALDKYYNEYFSTQGYSPEKMQEFRNNLAAIPELQKAAMDIVKANRVGELGEGSANYNAALQQIINGIADGAIYQRQSSMQRNLGQMTDAERAQYNLQVQGMDRQAAANGLTWDGKNNRFTYNIKNDPKYASELWKYDIDDATGQIKGYSKAYEDAVKKGMVPGKNIKMGANGNPTITGSQGSRKAKASMLFTPTGSKTVIAKDGRSLGKQITYTDAITKRPEIGFYIGEDSDLYDYWDNGVGIYVIGHGPEGQLTPEPQEGAPTNNNGNHNSL